jgi:hypothetical protein
MDPAASVAVAPAIGSGLKKQLKVRKPAKDVTPDERRKESEKRADQREAMWNRQNAARLAEERQLETERFLAVQALANSEELAGKAAVHAVMMMKQEAINVAFGGVASLPLLSVVGGALSTSSVTSTPSDRPPAVGPTRLSCMLLRWAPTVRAASRSLGLATSGPHRGQQGQASTSTAHHR